MLGLNFKASQTLKANQIFNTAKKAYPLLQGAPNMATAKKLLQQCPNGRRKAVATDCIKQLQNLSI